VIVPQTSWRATRATVWLAPVGIKYPLRVANPTKKQLDLLRKLASEKGQTFAEPSTSMEASKEIKRLLALKTEGFSRGRTSRAGHSRTRGHQIG
jgi:hypothetical protein